MEDVNTRRHTASSTSSLSNNPSECSCCSLLAVTLLLTSREPQGCGVPGLEVFLHQALANEEAIASGFTFVNRAKRLPLRSRCLKYLLYCTHSPRDIGRIT